MHKAHILKSDRLDDFGQGGLAHLSYGDDAPPLLD